MPEIDPHYFEQEIGLNTLLVPPAVLLKLLSSLTDLEIMVEGVKFVRNKFIKTAPYKDIIGTSRIVYQVTISPG